MSLLDFIMSIVSITGSIGLFFILVGSYIIARPIYKDDKK